MFELLVGVLTALPLQAFISRRAGFGLAVGLLTGYLFSLLLPSTSFWLLSLFPSLGFILGIVWHYKTKFKSVRSA
jgi:hypothetical protein